MLDVAGPKAEQGLQPLLPVLPFTDVFLPNQDEAALLTGESEALRQAEIFVEYGARTAVITRGADGVVVHTQQTTFSVPAFPVEVVDGSGAGDAFGAGYVVGLLEGWDLKRTIAFASAVGASACTQLGTTPGVFTRAEALAFLARQDGG